MKKIALLCLVFLFGLVLFSCTSKPPKELTLEISRASKVTVFSQENGKAIEITDPKIISELTEKITSHTYIRDKSSQGYDGSMYSIKWTGENGSQIDAVVIQNSSRISYKGYFYDKEECNCEIDLEYFGKLFSTAEE